MSHRRSTDSTPGEDKISVLIAALHETERRLEELTGGEVDTVTARDGRMVVLRSAQDQLRQIETANKAAILNALPAHVALLDAQGCIVSVNETWRRFASTNAMQDDSQGLGSNYLDVCDNAVGDGSLEAHQVAAGIRSILSGSEEAYSIEYSCDSPAQKRWFELTVTPLDENRSGGAIIMHVDVTPRRQAEEVLAESEQRFAEAFEHAPIGVALLSPEGRFTRVNRAFSELFGYSDDELLVRSIRDITHPDDLDESLELVRRAIAGETRSIEIEKRYVDRFGNVITALLCASLVRDSQGLPGYLIAHLQDVTARRLAENELRESNQKFQQLADNITDAFWIRSADMSKVHYVSPAFERIWGRSVDTIYNNPNEWTEFILPEDRERVLDSFAGLTKDTPTVDTEYRIVRPDGEVRWVRTRGFQVRDDVGKLIRNTGIVTDITERQQAVAELRASEEEFRSLAEAMPQIVWITSGDGRNIYFNQQWVAYTGLTLEESLGDGWSTPFHPDDRKTALAKWQQATMTGATYSIESRLRRADGIYRWWLMRALPLKDKSGTIVKWLGTCTDIHDMKVAELEISRSNRLLSESERRFTDMLGNVDMVSLMLDKNARITYCNDYMLQLTGWKREEVIGADWFERFIPPERKDVRSEFMKLLANDSSTWHHENEILTRAGRRRLIQWNNTVMRSANGDVIGTASIGVDITESRQMEASLQLNTAALEAAGEAILIADRDFNIVSVNPAFTELTGYSEEDALGRNPQDLLRSNAQSPHSFKTMAGRIQNGESWRGEVTNRRKNGTLYLEALTITSLKDAAGSIRSFICIKTDLTAQRQMEAQLRQAQKMEAVGQLAAGVAHEFNNLLQALMSMTTIMQLRSPAPEIATGATEMQSLIKRGAALTQQLLLFSRHRAIERAEINIGEQVRKASELLRHIIPATIAIVVETSIDPLHVQGDAGQIEQVLLNLAINARDAMPDRGTLTLRTLREGEEVVLEVEDTGQGMDEVTQRHLFEPFFTTKEPGKGTGLGLAVAHGIIQQHNGRIEVDSHLGKGSRFRIILPGSLREGPRAAAPIEEANVLAGGGRLLLVEDDASVRAGIAALLDFIGYEVIAVGSGEEALALTLNPPPDLLLSDVTLQGMTGPVLAERLRRRWPALRILLMSGYVEDATREQASKQRWHFLQKPFELGDLARELQNAMAQDVAFVN